MLLLLLACASDEAPPAMADQVFEGGTIYLSVDETTDRIAVTGGLVVAVADDIDERIGDSTEHVDLDGGVAWPGFTDAHVHLLAGSFVMDRLLLLGSASMTAITSKVATYADETPDEPWIVGYGWMRELVEDPSGVALDAVVSDRPVLLVDNSGHSALINSEAMRRAGIDADTPDPDGGEIVRDPETGMPTGYILEAALSLVSEVALQDYDDERLSSGLTDALDAFSKGGLTGIAEILASPGFDLSRPSIYADLEARGELPLRVHYFTPVFELSDIDAAAALRDEYDGDLVRFAGAKIWVDGSMGTSDAWVSEPLEGTTDDYGSHYFDVGELTEAVARAEDLGVALKMHVNGDAAVSAAIDALEAEAGRRGGLTQQHSLEHAVLVDEADRLRMAELGLVASVQPSHHIATDLSDIATAWGERYDDAYDYASLDADGIPLAFGTDWPVWPTPDALIQVWAASTAGDKGVDVATAMGAATAGSARSVGRADDLGCLHPGSVADIVVLEADPLDLDPSEVSQVSTLAIYLGGQKVR